MRCLTRCCRAARDDTRRETRGLFPRDVRRLDCSPQLGQDRLAAAGNLAALSYSSTKSSVRVTKLLNRHQSAGTASGQCLTGTERISLAAPAVCCLAPHTRSSSLSALLSHKSRSSRGAYKSFHLYYYSLSLSPSFHSSPHAAQSRPGASGIGIGVDIDIDDCTKTGGAKKTAATTKTAARPDGIPRECAHAA